MSKRNTAPNDVRQYGISFSPKQWEQLGCAAVELGTNRSELVRQLIARAWPDTQYHEPFDPDLRERFEFRTRYAEQAS